jgi:hypothetical protein
MRGMIFVMSFMIMAFLLWSIFWVTALSEVLAFKRFDFKTMFRYNLDELFTGL